MTQTPHVRNRHFTAIAPASMVVQKKSHFELNNDAHIEPVWVNIDNSTSIDPLENTFAVESSENAEEHEHPSDMKGNKFVKSKDIKL